jgi:hypothetical protein
VSKIDDLASMVHPRDGHPKIFVMLDAYLDESGIHTGAPICVIAGFFGGHGQWKKFERDWKRVLRRFEVPLEEFHAKDLFPKPRGFFLHHWDSSQHQPFLEEIGKTIMHHSKICPLTCGIVVDAFNSYSLQVRQFFTGADMGKDGIPRSKTSGCPNKPYFVPFQRCLMTVCNYTADGTRAHFFFGLDRPFAGYAESLFKRIKLSEGLSWKQKLGDPSFPLAKETPGLQAADFLVNLTYHHMLEVVNSGEPWGKILPSPLLGACINNRRSIADFQILTKAALDDVLEQYQQFIRELNQGTPDPK